MNSLSISFGMSLPFLSCFPELCNHPSSTAVYTRDNMTSPEYSILDVLHQPCRQGRQSCTSRQQACQCKGKRRRFFQSYCKRRPDMSGLVPATADASFQRTVDSACAEFDRAGRDHCRSKRKESKESNVDIKDRIEQSTGTLLGAGVFI